MPKLFNAKPGKARRKVLRNAMPKAEVIVWTALKNDQLGFRFRRQYGIGPYFIDFYCPKLKLAVEVDGPSHFLTDEQKEHDKKRTDFLTQQGITVFRCTNIDIYENLQGVVAAIIDIIGKLANSIPPRAARGTSS